MDFLLDLIGGGLWKLIAGVVGGGLALLGLYLRGRSDAKKDGTIAAQKEIINAHETRDKVDDAVAAADDTERQRLRDKWRRRS